LILYAAGDAKNEVLTGLSKLKYDPALYRANALQGLVYDPASKFHHFIGVSYKWECTLYICVCEYSLHTIVEFGV